MYRIVWQHRITRVIGFGKWLPDRATVEAWAEYANALYRDIDHRIEAQEDIGGMMENCEVYVVNPEGLLPTTVDTLDEALSHLFRHANQGRFCKIVALYTRSGKVLSLNWYRVHNAVLVKGRDIEERIDENGHYWQCKGITTWYHDIKAVAERVEAAILKQHYRM